MTNRQRRIRNRRIANVAKWAGLVGGFIVALPIVAALGFIMGGAGF